MAALKNGGGWMVGLHTVQEPQGTPEVRVSVSLDRGNGEAPVVMALSKAAAQALIVAMQSMLDALPPEGESS